MKLKLAALIMILAAVALAAAAFRLARKESDRHAAGLRDLLADRCVDLAGRCADVARAVQLDTEDLLRDARPTAEEILGLERRSPFIRDVFFLDSGYSPVYPDADSDFFKNYDALFFEMMTGAARPDTSISNGALPSVPVRNQQINSWSQSSYPVQTMTQSVQISQSNQADFQQQTVADPNGIQRQASPGQSQRLDFPQNSNAGAGQRSSNDRQSDRDTTAGQSGSIAGIGPPQNSNAVTGQRSSNDRQSDRDTTAGQSGSIAGIGSPQNSNAVTEEAGSQFELLSRGRSAGWIPWVNQNQFMPLVWIRQEGTGMIAGARIEAAAVIARLIPLISVPGDGFFHIQLTDGNSKVMTGSGYRLNDTETAAVAVEISRDSLPGFQLRGFLNPAVQQRGNSLAMANILLVASLLLVVLTSAGVAFYFVNREMILAGKKTSFVANVSHELKTPLTSIRMYSEMLRENLDRLPVSKRDHYLKVIVSESERLTRLIANILDFNKMEAAEKQYHPRPVEVREVVVETMKACDHLLADAGLRVELDLPDTEDRVLIDRDSLVQVIQNVVSNAVKYARGADTLRVSVTSPDARPVVIDIADNGPGVPPRARRKLFRKFYRVDNDLTAATSGSGLGLTISRKLMRDQGGDVHFAPNPGGGAVFSIILAQPANGPETPSHD